jgi:hypothetical protein
MARNDGLEKHSCGAEACHGRRKRNAIEISVHAKGKCIMQVGAAARRPAWACVGLQILTWNWMNKRDGN